MIAPFVCSLCQNGILGGALIVDGEAVTYKTGKVTVSPGLRNLQLGFDEIETLDWSGSFIPLATFSMKNGVHYKFLIFNKKRFQTLFERISRIRHMEALFDAATKEATESTPDPDTLKQLDDYYKSPLWKEDFAADEAGKLPSNLKRGVLSEDGLYNILEK
ncbi:MAG: DUF4298 domain-containing protein [Lachnospiraceae bacterium]|nr:DUF4298 domain-containing protein [Lachnospiraceae bacterium]